MNFGTKSKKLVRPSLAEWEQWTYRDYLKYFLSKKAAKDRLQPEPLPSSVLSDKEFFEFCRPIRERITLLYQSENPRISIILAAHNEERELLPTLVSYTCLDVAPGVAELIVVDNNSSDGTESVVKYCRAKYVYCATKGIGYARDAGFRAASTSSEYVWLSDSDTRVVAPLETDGELDNKSSILMTNLRYLDEHPTMLGISSGELVESAHWSYLMIHELALRFKFTSTYSCWAGCNQFIRKSALEEIGGIDVTVEWQDDQHRHFELARLGKRTGRHLDNANMNPSLADPVFFGGRRYASLRLVLRHLKETLTRPKQNRDEYGYPVHEQYKDWRQIRIH